MALSSFCLNETWHAPEQLNNQAFPSQSICLPILGYLLTCLVSDSPSPTSCWTRCPRSPGTSLRKSKRTSLLLSRSCTWTWFRATIQSDKGYVKSPTEQSNDQVLHPRNNYTSSPNWIDDSNFKYVTRSSRLGPGDRTYIGATLAAAACDISDAAFTLKASICLENCIHLDGRNELHNDAQVTCNMLQNC